MRTQSFSIYGDNIVECERFFSLIIKSFPEMKVEYDNTNLFCPVRILFDQKNILKFIFFPGIKTRNRWAKKSFLDYVVDIGAIITEVPDIFLCKEINGCDEIVFALEFSSSIPAGNQAWQRSGRAFELSKIHIPYLYLTEVGLIELGADRIDKSERYGNPLVSISYLKQDERCKEINLIVLTPSFMLNNSQREKYSSFLFDQSLYDLLKKVILSENYDKEKGILQTKVNNYIKAIYSSSYRQLKKIIEAKDFELEKICVDMNLKYSKKIAKKTPLKKEMDTLIRKIIPQYAIGVFSKNLPFCLIPSTHRIEFAKEIMKLYPKLPPKVKTFVKVEKPLIVSLVNGFKPRGDDSRPDRGLIPFIRMLVGKEVEVLSLVFGQAPSNTQKLFSDDPYKLAHGNGLWNSILYYSDLTLADSINWNFKDMEKFCFRLNQQNKDSTRKPEFHHPDNKPLTLDENDVDTAIHITMNKSSFVFESMCNPPGGDWSGISLKDTNKNIHRWLSLPRVSKTKKKRPDHIFQIFYKGECLILIIESKEHINGLIKEQANLGDSLKGYLTDLIKTKANAINIKDSWQKNKKESFPVIFQMISAAAFIYSNATEIEKAKKELKVDLLIMITKGKESLEIQGISSLGLKFKNILKDLRII